MTPVSGRPFAALPLLFGILVLAGAAPAQPESVPEPVWSLRVEVVDASGLAVADVEVTAIDAYATGYPRIDRSIPATRYAVRRTDRSGSASMACGVPVALFAEGPRGDLAFVDRVEPHAGTIVLRLEPPATLLPPDDSSIEVELQSVDSLIPIRPRPSADGSFAAPRGNWWVIARSADRGSVQRLQLDSGQRVVLAEPIVALSPERLIQGNAVEGEGPGGFRVDLCDARLRPSFRQPIPDGFRSFVFCQSHHDRAEEPGQVVWSRTVLESRAGADLGSLLKELRSVRPTPDRDSPPGASVQQVVGHGSNGSTTVLSQFGTLTSLPSGRLLVTPEAEVLVVYTDGADRFLHLGAREDLIIPRAEAASVLELSVRTPEGTPLGDIRATTGIDRVPVFHREARSNPSGLVVFTRLPRVDRRIVVLQRSDGFPRRFEILGDPARADIRWEPGAPMIGRAVGPDGGPIVGLTVELRSPELGSRVDPIYRTTDEHGGFRFEDLPERVFLLSARTELGGAPHIGQLRATPDPDGSAATLILRLVPEDPLPPGHRR